MFLQRNLFSIYRMIIKIPKLILLSALIFMVFVAFTQIVYISKTNKTIDISSTLLQYMIKKNKQRQTYDNNTLENTTNIQNITKDIIKSNDYTLIDDSTLLQFQFEKSKFQRIELDYDQKFQKLPFMSIIKNQKLYYLNNKPSEYLKKHQITYDRIIIPSFEIQKPLFSYYFNQNMQQNQIMLQSLSNSFFNLEYKFNFYRIFNNITQIQMDIGELYLNYYEIVNNHITYEEFSFSQFLSLKLQSQIIYKILFTIHILALSFGISIFMGLLIRYTIISMFTLFLIIYDKFMVDGAGWVHQYLIILYQRYQQNRLGTLKIMLFYIISNIGMSLLLALGAYCIIFKLLAPFFFLLSEEYSIFYIKTIFFIELYHYVLCRSRVTIKYFPIISLILNITFATICSLKKSTSMMMLLNLNMTFQIINFIVFIIIQSMIQQENDKGLLREFCPSYNKPRMIFYAGYDISWQKSLPPIWTYFTRWFDYSYFNEGQKCLIEKDYQLLYGRMLGLNDRQQIPEEQIQLREQVVVEPFNQSSTNASNLIQ